MSGLRDLYSITYIYHTHTHTHTHIYIYINGIVLSYKKNERLPFAVTWMDLESIILSEICQKNTNIV